MTAFLAGLHYRGSCLSANFLNFTAGTVLLLFLILLGGRGVHGPPANFHPLFRASPIVSVLLTLQIVPYFLTGFESAPKTAEEASADFPRTGYLRAITFALLVGAAFY